MAKASPSTPLERSATAEALRSLARQAEKLERSLITSNGDMYFFTCVRVADSLGDAFAYKYQRMFCNGHRQEKDLWRDPMCMSRRILSLGFMAAMVEAGDA